MSGIHEFGHQNDIRFAVIGASLASHCKKEATIKAPYAGHWRRAEQVILLKIGCPRGSLLSLGERAQKFKANLIKIKSMTSWIVASVADSVLC